MLINFLSEEGLLTDSLHDSIRNHDLASLNSLLVDISDVPVKNVLIHYVEVCNNLDASEKLTNAAKELKNSVSELIGHQKDAIYQYQTLRTYYDKLLDCLNKQANESYRFDA